MSVVAPSGVPIAIVMGSQSDWKTMKCTANVLDELDIAYSCKIISAHRTPDRLFDFARSACDRGYRIIIAGAGGAAHLPGMIAAITPIPVLGVPIQSKALQGYDSLLSIVQMPAGIPVGTLAIGRAGATNAALMGAAILALHNNETALKLNEWRTMQSKNVPLEPDG